MSDPPLPIPHSIIISGLTLKIISCKTIISDGN